MLGNFRVSVFQKNRQFKASAFFFFESIQRGANPPPVVKGHDPRIFEFFRWRMQVDRHHPRGIPLVTVAVAQPVDAIAAQHRESPDERGRLFRIIVCGAVPHPNESILHRFFRFAPVTQHPASGSKQHLAPHSMQLGERRAVFFRHPLDQCYRLAAPILTQSGAEMGNRRKVGVGLQLALGQSYLFL